MLMLNYQRLFIFGMGLPLPPLRQNTSTDMRWYQGGPIVAGRDLAWHRPCRFVAIYQWIGLRENLQESPIFNGKIYGFL
jgi:hypothetical protein